MGSKCESLNDMDQLSPEIVAEFPERGMQWVKDRVETVVNETGDYVREKPTQSLLYAFAAGYVLNRLPLGRVLAGFLRLLFIGTKTRDLDLRRRQTVQSRSGAGSRSVALELNGCRLR